MLTGSSRVTLSQSLPSRIQWGVTSSPRAFPGVKTENSVRIAVRSRKPSGKEGAWKLHVQHSQDLVLVGHPLKGEATRKVAKEKLRHQEPSPLGNLRAARVWGAGLRSEVPGRSPDPRAEGLGRRRRQPWVFLDRAVDAFRVRDMFGGLLCHLSKTATRCLSHSS